MFLFVIIYFKMKTFSPSLRLLNPPFKIHANFIEKVFCFCSFIKIKNTMKTKVASYPKSHVWPLQYFL